MTQGGRVTICYQTRTKSSIMFATALFLVLLSCTQVSSASSGSSEDEEQQLLMDQQPKTFIPNGIEKGQNDFIRSTRLSEFLGGPGKRYSYIVRSQNSPGYLLAKKLSEFPQNSPGYFLAKKLSEFSQASPGYLLAKKLSEFLGGPGKKRPRSNEGYFTWLNPSRPAGGFPEGSEFLGGPGRK